MACKGSAARLEHLQDAAARALNSRKPTAKLLTACSGLLCSWPAAQGLREVAAKLERLSIPFYLLRGSPEDTLPDLVASLKAGLVVTDYSPLRLSKQWKQQVWKCCSWRRW